MTRKIVLLAGLFLLIAGSVSATHNEGIFSGYSDSTGISFSEFSTSSEFLTTFVAPFVLMFLVFQRGLEKALMVTLDENDNNPLNNVKQEKKRLKKYSIVMALAITGMIVPTRFFSLFNDAVSWAFGGGVYILIGTATVYFLYRLFSEFL